MKRLRLTILSAPALTLVAASEVFGQTGDVTRGRELFEECAACHSLEREADEDALGPPLSGVLNREAGTRDDYRYSRALTASRIVWTLETIDAFVADPQGYLRGNRMAYAGMREPADRADLMAYLAEVLTEATAEP